MLPPWSKAELRPSRRASLSFVTKPRVSAETAGAKASPATARMLSATAMGQKVGAAKMRTPATVIAAIARTMMPRLARVTSIAAPIGVWSAIPSKPAPVDTSPTSVWLQCRPVTRKTLMNGPKRFRTSAERKLSASSATGTGIIAASQLRLNPRGRARKRLLSRICSRGSDPLVWSVGSVTRIRPTIPSLQFSVSLLSASLDAAFVAATVVLMLVPGPNVALIVANSLAFGARTGLVTVMGTIVGMVAQLSVAALGVTALFEALAQGFATLRWLGVAYLLWLGFRDWRTPAGDLSRIAPVSPRKIFIRGFLVSLTNPK